ncbi:hypothetical protein SLS58_007961 [Diplodia intermedia]|uniref:Uncharacterized protein n=1 Tax=Diplodia intermedia TaxID=856260 RepID=A0ABR3TIL5_9PEZI
MNVSSFEVYPGFVNPHGIGEFRFSIAKWVDKSLESVKIRAFFNKLDDDFQVTVLSSVVERTPAASAFTIHCSVVFEKKVNHLMVSIACGRADQARV